MDAAKKSLSSLALGTPIGYPNVKPELDQFIRPMKASGQLAAIIGRSGLRGVAK